MPLRNARPVRWSPTGLCDSLDGTESFKGAMSSLSNLVPDPTTKNLWVPRPAALSLTALLGVASCLYIVGSFAYGMRASTAHAGKDEPFCYNLATSSLVTISGVTGSNLPTSLSTSGPWSPPHMDLIGVKITLAHVGFDGITNFVGWINISNPAAPVYSAGNTSTNALPSVPIWVTQFGQRAYYLVNPAGATPAAIATDVLDPTSRSMTVVDFVLTFGDNVPLTCAVGLPLNNILGGVLQSLIVFKGDVNMFQVTGDFSSTTSPIAQNSLNIATGTLAPNSLCPTPLGVMFISPEGMRIIDFNAHVSDPIGEPSEDGQAGVVVPFVNAVIPSRIASACNAKVIRITTQNGDVQGSPMQDYWFDLVRKVWSGPHTFPANLISAYGDTFVMVPNAVPASLFQSDAAPDLTSSYTENGTALMWSYSTVLLPVRQDMNQCVMMNTVLYFGYAPGAGAINVQAQDQRGSVLGSVTLQSPPNSTIWGDFIWGEAIWGGAAGALSAQQLQWAKPIEFDRASITATGQSGKGVQLGDLYLEYQPLGYLAGSYSGTGS